MGSGRWDNTSYTTNNSIRGYAHKSADEIFSSNFVISNSASDLKATSRKYSIAKPDFINVGVRESRDSAEHPFTTPIIIALDVTGSMGRIPHELLTNHLPKMMEKLLQHGITDPQLLFIAVGDHECDQSPIQISQFESDTEKIMNSLESMYIESGGGGNQGESYFMPWIIAGRHTETDSWFLRKKKGFLFTIGDENCLHGIDSYGLSRFMNYEKGAEGITAEQALKEAKEQYHIWHIHCNDGSYRFSDIQKTWLPLLGQNLLSSTSTDVANLIADTIGNVLKQEREQEDGHIMSNQGVSQNDAPSSNPTFL